MVKNPYFGPFTERSFGTVTNFGHTVALFSPGASYGCKKSVLYFAPKFSCYVIFKNRYRNTEAYIIRVKFSAKNNNPSTLYHYSRFHNTNLNSIRNFAKKANENKDTVIYF